jgi:Trk-type K+ transport system membrane component
MTPDASFAIRRLLLLVLTLGFIGTAADLILLEHYEDSWQLIPLFLIAVALLTIGAYAVTGSAVAIRVLQLVMVFCMVAGAIGFGLHYKGNLEIQMDMDPTLSQWELFKKVIRAKAPPALAPAAMAQLGLLGLIFSYRHPALRDQA